MPEWTNVDKFPGPEVDLVVDLERNPWPWATASVDAVRAERVFNHLHNWEDAMDECARILKPDGDAEIIVHNGLLPLLVMPHEMRAFGPRTFDAYCDNITKPNPNLPFLRIQPDFRPFRSLEFEVRYFSKLSLERLHENYPFAWHLAKYIGDWTFRLPLGRTTNLRFRFRRNRIPWRLR